MFAEIINRQALKRQIREKCKTAQVPVLTFTGLYLVLVLVLNLLDLGAAQMGGENLLATFASILTGLIGSILFAGFVYYCMTIRKSQRAEYLTLFDGFSLAGKLIVLAIVKSFFIMLWSMLFFFPGVVAAYRYRFAEYNLLENPDLSAFQALDMSKRQTVGYKYQLFIYDISYMGWSLLSQLPSIYFNAQTAYTVTSSLLADGSAPIFAGPGLLPLLLVTLWGLGVQLFYLPQMICGDLAYFETAKRTSGVGVDNGPSDFDPPTIRINRPGQGPDNMGGYNNPDVF